MIESPWVSRGTKDQQNLVLDYFSSPGEYEVEFYLPETRQLNQVTQNLNYTPTRKREVRALQDAIRALKAKRP